MHSIYKVLSVILALHMAFAPTYALAGNGNGGGNGGNNDEEVVCPEGQVLQGNHCVDGDHNDDDHDDNGNSHNASIEGIVFNDLNNNGTQDNGEPGIAGITVSLHEGNDDYNSPITTTDVTGADGEYYFGSLDSGYYFVEEMEPAEWDQTTSDTEVHLTGHDNDTVHFANVAIVIEEPVIDVCPNIEGDQATLPEGKVMLEGNCVDPTPSNETPPSENNGGNSGDNTPPANTNSGGGNGGGYVMSGPLSIGYVNSNSVGGIVLGTSTEVASTSLVATCVPLLSSYMREGRANDSAQVKKLQEFLNAHLGLTIAVTGEFEEETTAGVNAFQVKYKEEVLKPWIQFGHNGETPTGFVYKTTLAQINKLACATLEAPVPQLP